MGFRPKTGSGSNGTSLSPARPQNRILLGDSGPCLVPRLSQQRPWLERDPGRTRSWTPTIYDKFGNPHQVTAGRCGCPHSCSPTSQSTARWSQRTTGRQRAHRPLWPRDTPPATKPVLSAVEGPKAKQGKTTRSGNEPAGPCSARCRESAENRHERRCRTPINPPKRSQTLCDDAPIAPKPSLRRLRLPRSLPENGV